MKHGVNKNGFTLLEALVAMAIVVSIVSMVYGSYFATSKSAEVYKARMTTSESAGGVLQQMARQIRCSYARAAGDSAAFPARRDLPKTQGILEKPISYFKGGFDLPTGEILHLVTTARFFGLDDLRDGLFDVVYKFDKSTHTLLVSQKRFVEAPTGLAEDRDFSAAVEGLEDIELAFFDGGQWLDEWDFSLKRKLPRAVRIGIVCEDENGRKCSYGATAYVHCLRNLNNKKQAR